MISVVLCNKAEIIGLIKNQGLLLLIKTSKDYDAKIL